MKNMKLKKKTILIFKKMINPIKISLLNEQHEFKLFLKKKS